MVTVSYISKYLKLFIFCSILKLSWFGCSISFSLPTFNLDYGIFFNAKVNSYILAAYSNCSYKGPQFFFIFGKYLYVNHIDKVINIFNNK